MSRPTVQVARRPAQKASAGHFDFKAGPDGVQRQVWCEPISAREEGPLAVWVGSEELTLQEAIDMKHELSRSIDEVAVMVKT